MTRGERALGLRPAESAKDKHLAQVNEAQRWRA